jgi:hypothetical protein
MFVWTLVFLILEKACAGEGQVNMRLGKVVNNRLDDFDVKIQKLRTFNPDELKRGWYFREDGLIWNLDLLADLEKSSNDNRERNCFDDRNIFWRVSGRTGQANNCFIEFTNLLLFVASMTTRWHDKGLPTSVQHVAVASNACKNFNDMPFEWKIATRSWVCAIDQASFPTNASISAVRVPANTIFYFWPKGGLYHSNTRGTMMSQILLRPKLELRRKVEAFEMNHLASEKAAPLYIAIHLRDLDGKCIVRANKTRSYLVKQRVLHISSGTTLTPEDVCFFSNRYLDAAVAMAMAELQLKPNFKVEKVKFFLAHDRHRVEDAKRIMARYGAIEAPPGSSVYFDTLMLIRSSFLIGNPWSSLSENAHSVRAATMGNYWAIRLTQVIPIG